MRRSATQIGPLERLLYIKTLPGVGERPSDALASLAQHAEEQFHKPGDVFISPDGPVDAIHFVVSGAAWTYYQGKPAIRIEPPGGIGFLGLLAGHPQGVAAVAEGRTTTLRVAADVVYEIMEDHPSFGLTGLRDMALQLLEIHGGLPVQSDGSGATPELGDYPATPLDFVQRLIVLSEGAGFGGGNVDALAGLAERVREVRFEPGEVMFRAGDPSNCGLTMLWGAARCEAPDGVEVRRIVAPYGLGYLDSMAGRARSYTASAETRVVALRGDVETFFDTLVEEPAILFNMLSWQARGLLEVYTARAQAQAEAA
jgi:CRP-like cAMP-binding protein